MDGSARIALVTGANRGIGKEVARGLLKHGVHVLLGARDAELGHEAATELRSEGGVVSAIRLDVTDDASVAHAAAEIGANHGRLDILVNNAGVFHELDFVPPSEVSMERVRATFAVNTFGPIAVTQAMLPLLHASAAGRIVNVTSGLSSLAVQADLDSSSLTLLGYNSSKAALNAATLQFARELRHTSIKINLADPMHCATAINNWSGERTASDGAEIVVELALLDEDGPSGTFVNANGPVSW